MDSSKLAFKIYLADGFALPPAKVTAPIFHAWIQSHELAGHVLIDVADYAHVPNGPGVLLVSDEANIYLDELDGRPGLTYSRKRPLDGSLDDRIRETLANTLRCAAMLEADANLGGALKFSTRELSFKINDRLLGPNTVETFKKVEPALKAVAARLFGDSSFTIEYKADALRLFEVVVRSSSGDVDSKPLIAKLDLFALAV